MTSTLEKLTHQGIHHLGKTIEGRIQTSTETPVHLSYTAQSAPKNTINTLRRSITGNTPIQAIKLQSNEQVSENEPYTQLFSEWRRLRDAYGDSTKLQTGAFTLFLDGVNSKSGFVNTYIKRANNYTEEDIANARKLFNHLEISQQPDDARFEPEIVYFPRSKQLHTIFELVSEGVPFDMRTCKEESGPQRIEEHQFKRNNGDYKLTRTAKIYDQGLFGLSTKDFIDAEHFLRSLHPHYSIPSNWKLHVYEKPLAKNAID